MKLCRLALASALAAVSAVAGDGDWRAQVSPAAPGDFRALPSIAMDFSFGWSDLIQAGEARAELVERGGSWHAKVDGRSLGGARLLWRMDASHNAEVAADTLLPRSVEQDEKYRRRAVTTRLRFDARGVDRFREVSTSKSPTRWKRVNFPSIRDVIGGVLFVRSQPLKDGDRIGVVCFPGDSPYFVVVNVERRERIPCMGRDMPAIRLTLEIRKLEVEKKVPTRAVEHAKFKSGTVWVSDDELRLPLRAEVRIFVGYVYGELTGYDWLAGSSSSR